MSREITRLLCLLSAALFGTAIIANAATKPIAYVYVTSNYSGSNNRVVGYSAAANGKLTAIPGSPFADNIGSMAVNGKYLFGSDNNPNSDRNVYSYLMESNGALKYLGATDIQYNGNTCAGPGPLVLDHTGADLYVFAYDVDCSDDDAFMSYKVNSSTGKLSYLSEATGNFYFYFPLTIIGNNSYAYNANCVYFGGSTINGYQRQSDGALTGINENFDYPPAPTNDAYCNQYATADPTNHLAVDEELESQPPDGSRIPGSKDQIASYTVDKTNGNLTTNSTYESMPHTAVVSVLAMNMAPSGKLLAVGGTGGLQIFNFNGANPLTVNTGLLTTDEIDGLHWDNANHLYAISTPHGKLFVFTVTATSAKQAPGSPYTIAKPRTMIVQPK